MAVGGEDDGGGLGEVGARGARDTGGGADAVGDDAGGLRDTEVGLVVLGVPAVTQDGGGQARCGEVFLGRLVFGRQDQGADVRPRGRRVGDAANPGGDGGIDGGPVLRKPFAHFAARDEEHLVGALQWRGQRRCVVEVDGEGGHARVGEFGEAFGVASEGADPVGGHTAGQQCVDGETAELSGGSENGDGHDCSLLCRSGGADGWGVAGPECVGLRMRWGRTA